MEYEKQLEERLGFRPITDDDLPFLFEVYSSARADEMSLTGWHPEQVQEFLKLQFKAQHQYYRTNFKSATFDIILLDGRPVGRLYVDRRLDEIRIIDIALLPQRRRQGIGSLILKSLLSEAQKEARPVTLHVEYFNPALNLYQRLGFKKIEDRGIHSFMEWSPQKVENPGSKN